MCIQTLIQWHTHTLTQYYICAYYYIHNTLFSGAHTHTSIKPSTHKTHRALLYIYPPNIYIYIRFENIYTWSEPKYTNICTNGTYRHIWTQSLFAMYIKVLYTHISDPPYTMIYTTHMNPLSYIRFVYKHNANKHTAYYIYTSSYNKNYTRTIPPHSKPCDRLGMIFL